MKEKKVLYLKIGACIFLSLIFTRFLLKNVYIANSPYFRNDLNPARILASLTESGQTILSKLFGKNQFADIPLEFIPFKSIEKGIYAKENKTSSYTLYKEAEIEWYEFAFEYKGKKHILKIPKGQSPPPQEVLEKLYQ